MPYAGAGLTELNSIMKEWYQGVTLTQQMFQNNPAFALLKKKTDVGGKYYTQPLAYGSSQGIGSLFASAQANQTAAKTKEFLVPMALDYGLATTTRQAQKQSSSGAGAFEDAVKLQIDTTLQGVSNSIATKLYRSGTGSIGQIASITTGVATLVNPSDAFFFTEGMTVDATATDGGTKRSGIGYVISVDMLGGTVTFSATQGGAAGTPTAWVGNDYLVQDGNAIADGAKIITGFAGWIPPYNARPQAGENFFGVDRSVNSLMLAGVSFNGSGIPVKEALNRAATLTSKFGGRSDYAFMSTDSYTVLINSLEGQKQYIDVKVGGVGFSGIEIMGPRGVIKVIADPNAIPKSCFLLQSDTWTLVSNGDAPEIQDDEGMILYKRPDADAFEARVSSYSNLVCSAPAWNANITLGA
jgi:hypothetical protein